MRNRLITGALLLSVAVLLCMVVNAQVSDDPNAQAPTMVDETPQAWLIELTTPPTSEGGSLSATRQDKTDFRNYAAGAKVRFKERYAYDVLFNGLSVVASRRDLPGLMRAPNVKAIFPVVHFKPDPVKPINQGDLYTALGMTGADIAQNTLGLTGKGVRVGVIDTGIDYRHPDLGGSGPSTAFPTKRVKRGYDFVGDDYDSSGTAEQQVPHPDNDPLDCNGHGTHVSGIVGANGDPAKGGVRGVAPGVEFAAYRVFGCEGTTDSDIMILAMERALADHVDVINMSIGAAFQWPQYPTGEAASRLVRKGVVVVASIGNDGDKGLYAVGAPGVGENVIGVASVENLKLHVPAFTITPDNKAIGYFAAAAAPAPPTSGSADLVRTGTQTTANDGCNPLAAGSLTGKVALIRRGTCSFYQKSFNAQSAGAIGVVLYNNAAGVVSPTVAGTPAITIPVVMVLQVDGNLIDTRLASGPVTMTWTAGFVDVANPTGGLISTFSSYGLAPDLSVKPDIAAPGGNIFSTYPIDQGSYATLSGTSMSSPHVAGTAALYLQAHPHTPAVLMRDLLQNTATPRLFNLALPFLDTVTHQGAGMVQIDKAATADAHVYPGKLSLNERGTATRVLLVTNETHHQITFNLSATNALSIGGPSDYPPNDLFVDETQVTFDSNTLKVPAHWFGFVKVTITPDPTLPDRTLYGGYIELTPTDEGQAYRVPFAGFKGDYQAIPVMTPTANGFPWLAKVIGDEFVKQPDGGTFTMDPTTGDFAYLLIHFDHQSRLVSFEVFDANTGKSFHRMMPDLTYFGKNSSASGFFALPWDGFTTWANPKLNKWREVPDGQYIIKVTVLKALGDPRNPAHLETFTTPTITIARP